MTERQERAIKVRQMLHEAEILSMESKRLGRKFAACGAILEDEVDELDYLDRMDYVREVRR